MSLHLTLLRDNMPVDLAILWLASLSLSLFNEKRPI